jgi:sulfate permease, SulP family
MLVALPSAIAFGVTIYAPLGGSYAAAGAVAGIVGASALGLVASLLGGTKRLITAPCAPAAAILSAFAIDMVARGIPAGSIVILLGAVALLAGVVQVAMGAMKVGRLIRYMPYPVVSGYLTGVGLIIVTSQLPKMLGAPRAVGLWEALAAPESWRWQAVVVGLLTIGAMSLASRMMRLIPGAIAGLAIGIIGYFLLSIVDPSLRSLADNPFVVGPIGGSGSGFVAALAARWQGVGTPGLDQLALVAVPALTLSVLLSIDTLKTCVVVDAVTRTRHDSDRELIGQGCGNIAAGALGGIPGAGTMGATLVNISSGGATRLSSVVEGGLALIAFLLLGSLIAWVPIAALAGILIVVGVRMLDFDSLHLLRSRSTAVDFVVIGAVIVTALTVSLIAASAVGIALAILLFLRAQIGGSAVRSKGYGDQLFSKRVRLPSEMAILRERGNGVAIFELQGTLFFGTANQLQVALEPELTRRRFVLLDFRRVQSVDVTAAHALELARDTIAERGGKLILSNIGRRAGRGAGAMDYLGAIEAGGTEGAVRVFAELDAALEWAEDRLLEDAGAAHDEERPLELAEMELFRGRKPETLSELEDSMDIRVYGAGEPIFRAGDTGDELFLIRRGAVRIMLPVGDGQSHHLATFGRGDFFGEVAFLDKQSRSADALAVTDVELFVLPRSRFDGFATRHNMAAHMLLEGLARGLAFRLRYANAELQVLQS